MYVQFYNINNVSTPANTTLATLPSDFRPFAEIRQFFQTGNFIAIKATGEVYIGATSSYVQQLIAFPV